MVAEQGGGGKPAGALNGSSWAWRMARIGGILIDKDGTLLDFEATWSPVLRRLALDAAGADRDAAEAMLVAGGLDPATGRYGPDSIIGAGTTEQIARLFHPTLEGFSFIARIEQIDKALRKHGMRNAVPIDGAWEALEALAGMGLAMGVATNDRTMAAKETLAAVDMDRYLPHVFGFDSVAAPKPAPDMVNAFAAATGVPVAEIVVVGDNRADLRMARAAGAGFAIGVTSGNSQASDLAVLADAVLDSIREVPAWVAESNRRSPQNKK
jgi:phosphoglycolate phosphatase